MHEGPYQDRSFLFSAIVSTFLTCAVNLRESDDKNYDCCQCGFDDFFS